MIPFALPFVLLATLAPAPSAVAADARESTAVEQKARKKSRALDRPYGREGDPRKVKRVISIELSDAMRFFPSELRVKRGETVRFELRNSGQMPHGLVIGTMDDLKKRAALVRRKPEVAHDEGHGVKVEPGGTSRLVWQFTRPGEFHYGCLVPGHFDAGMIGTIVVR